MRNALVFILRTLFDLYILTFALRLLLQWAAVDKRNPLVQFILRVTNP
ncbi:MAG: YggT family protein, partial [Phycisphaerales bacterium]|nr:YggT family protein [Phycisphaerales bacterium]